MAYESINVFPSTPGSRNDRLLIAALHMDSVAEEDNIRGFEESLLERIKRHDSRKRARADQVLALISCEKRLLILAETQSFVHPQGRYLSGSELFICPRH